MSATRSIRCYQYVNRPFGAVRALLRERPLEVLQRATSSAATRANALRTSLHLAMGAIDVAVAVRVGVGAIRDEEGVAGLSPVTRIAVQWEAVQAPALFPVMSATLSLWQLTATETQIELEGAYEPPFGVVGSAADAILGHRVAEAVVHRLLEDVVEQLRRELPES